MWIASPSIFYSKKTKNKPHTHTQSRTRSTRGAKKISIYVDDVNIFQGTIPPASGSLEISSSQKNHPAEAIYLIEEGVMKSKMVEMISQYDDEDLCLFYPDISNDLVNSVRSSIATGRPSTADTPTPTTTNNNVTNLVSTNQEIP
jgi:hypothetical protein